MYIYTDFSSLFVKQQMFGKDYKNKWSITISVWESRTEGRC